MKILIKVVQWLMTISSLSILYFWDASSSIIILSTYFAIFSSIIFHLVFISIKSISIIILLLFIIISHSF